MPPSQALPKLPRGRTLTYGPPEVFTLANVRELQDFLPLLAFPFALSSTPCKDGGKVSVDVGLVQGSRGLRPIPVSLSPSTPTGRQLGGRGLKGQSVTHPKHQAHTLPPPPVSVLWVLPACSDLSSPHHCPQQQGSPSSRPRRRPTKRVLPQHPHCCPPLWVPTPWPRTRP